MVLMDISMPVMNGLDATREIRKMKKNIPVLAITANAFDEDIKRILEAGLDDIVLKPVDEEQLMNKISNWMGRSRGNDEPVRIPEKIDNLHFYFIGIKGTGMAALAELYTSLGARITGSDVEEVFYTDQILAQLPVTVLKGFSASHVEEAGSIDFAVRSSAYGDDHPEVKAVREKGIPLFNYTQALGELSRYYASTGIAGVHGKTTTTGLTGTLLRELGLPASVLVGSGVSSFGGSASWCGGTRYFVAETCEYQRHFLDFNPRRIVLTSVEPDHLDYFQGYLDILSAFMEYIDLLPEGGELIYCADDPGAVEAAQRSSLERPDLKLIPYGETAEGPYRITLSRLEEGRNMFRLGCWDRDFVLPFPGSTFS